MSESPIGRLLGAVDALDLDGAIAFAAPEISFLAVDGRRAEGAAEMREALADFLGALRATTHAITAEWHVEEFWIAEAEASYELRDRARIGPLPRAFVARDGERGLTELRAYGAHEQPLADYARAEDGLRLGGYWVPPL
ncbi:MAG: hypothetical protein ACLQBB_13125 [Solirubrobacteraceae bacterium]